MPRRVPPCRGDLVYHVHNRAVRRATLFFTRDDYLAFVAVLREAAVRYPTMRLLGWDIMKNHWHLALWPREDGDLTAYASWISVTHTCRWHLAHGTRGTGHVYQGRFGASAADTSFDLLRVCRYVEGNAVKHRVVERVDDWPWSSASSQPLPGGRPPLHEWPVPEPPEAEWSAILNERTTKVAYRLMQQYVDRIGLGASREWREAIARHAQAPSIPRRSRGRPRKSVPE